MKISRILSIIMVFLMGTKTINATEKEVNGQPYVQLETGRLMCDIKISKQRIKTK